MREVSFTARGLSVVLCSVGLACGRIAFDDRVDAGQVVDAQALGDAMAPDGQGADGGALDARAEVDAAPELDATVAPDAPPDAAVCSESPCRLVVPQCGCPAELMCQRVGATSDVRGCIATGTLPPDALCSNDGQCVPGYACLTADGVTGRCHRYCAGDGDCSSGLACAKYIEGSTVGVCGSSCTLESGCPVGSACKVLLLVDLDSTEPVVAPTCTDQVGASAGAPCTSSFDCAPGLFCDADVCRSLCPLAMTTPCTTGTCMPVIVPIVLGGVEHGVCK